MRRAVVSVTVALAVITLASPVPNTNAASERKPLTIEPQTVPQGPICFSTAPFPDILVWFLDRHGNTANALHFDGVGRDLSLNRTQSVSITFNLPNPTELRFGYTTYPQPGAVPPVVPVIAGGRVSLTTLTGPGECFSPDAASCGAFTMALIACPATAKAAAGRAQGQQ
jgi:prepilin-type processing-associated H-X9-DG protein